MNTSLEIQVLQLYERALAQPEPQRAAWLARQDVPAQVRAGVQGLLGAEAAATQVLDSPAAATQVLDASGAAVEEAAPEFPKVGERLGSYELLRPLEAGGMGVVYLGRRADDVYEQQVAIKLVRPVHLLAAADFRRQLITRFEEERSILARMSHPNVARILDGGSTAGGIPYLVMEFVDGVSLTDYCRDQRLDVDARLKIFGKVCDGVQEAHRHLIVHRDLKPDNILVGANGEPRLLDFGIAKILEQEPLAAEKGTSLSAMTPAYASPEQVRQEALTTSSDVYSLGVVLYLLLTGARPYELSGLRPAEAERLVCEFVPETMRRMLEKAPLTESERKARRVQITPDVERIVAKAMHKESARRYGSAQELADDIRRYLDGHPVQAHPDSRGYRLRKFLRRHRIGVSAASLALAAILAATATAFWQADQARRAARDTAEVNVFLSQVLKSSDPMAAGLEIPLSVAVDAAAARLERRFPGRPDLSAPIRVTLGSSMINRFELEGAQRQLQLAFEESAAAFGDDDLRTLQAKELLAQLRTAQGRLDEAETMYVQLLATLEAQGRDDGAFYANVLGNYGNLHLERGDYAKAQPLLQRAHTLAPRVTDPQLQNPNDAPLLLANLATAAQGLGDLDLAEKLYAQAQADMEALDPADAPELVYILNNRALLLQERGDGEGAFRLWQQSLALRQRTYDGDHPLIALATGNLAMQALTLQKYDYGLDLANQGAEMADRVFVVPVSDQVFVHLVQAQARMVNKDFPGAHRSLDRALAVLAQVREPQDHLAPNIAQVRGFVCGHQPPPRDPACAGLPAASAPAPPEPGIPPDPAAG